MPLVNGLERHSCPTRDRVRTATETEIKTQVGVLNPQIPWLPDLALLPLRTGLFDCGPHLKCLWAFTPTWQCGLFLVSGI